MSLFGSWAEAAQFRDLEEVKDFLGLGRQVWVAFTTQVGDPANDLRLFAALPRVAVVGAGNQATFPDGSPLLPLQATQVGLVWRLCRKVVAARAGTREDQFEHGNSDGRHRTTRAWQCSWIERATVWPEGEGPEDVDASRCSR